MRFKSIIIVVLFSVCFGLAGCGGGGGGSGTSVLSTEADQLLTSQLIGTWKLSQATKVDKLVPVKPNTAGQVSIIVFSADGTAISTDYTITTSNTVGPVDPTAPAIDTDFYQTKDDAPIVAGGSWVVSGGKMYSTNAAGETFTNAVEIKNGELYQTMSDGEVRVWER